MSCGRARSRVAALFGSLTSVSPVTPFANLDSEDEADQKDPSDQAIREAEATSRKECCNKMCKQLLEPEFLATRLMEVCANIDAVPKTDKDSWLFDLIRGCRTAAGDFEYKLLGQKVCKAVIKQSLRDNNHKTKHNK